MNRMLYKFRRYEGQKVILRDFKGTKGIVEKVVDDWYTLIRAEDGYQYAGRPFDFYPDNTGGDE